MGGRVKIRYETGMGPKRCDIGVALTEDEPNCGGGCRSGYESERERKESKVEKETVEMRLRVIRKTADVCEDVVGNRVEWRFRNPNNRKWGLKRKRCHTYRTSTVTIRTFSMAVESRTATYLFCV